MHEIHVASHLQVDVAHLLQFAEDFQIAAGDFRQRRHRECGAAAGDAAPRTAVVVVHKNRLEALLGKVTERCRSGHAASGDQSAHLNHLRLGEFCGGDKTGNRRTFAD